MAAAIIRPYVRAEVPWTLEIQDLFQMYHCADRLDLDKDSRDAYRRHKYFVTDINFCEKWGQISSDPDYPIEELKYFEPLVREIFTRPPFDPTILRERG